MRPVEKIMEAIENLKKSVRRFFLRMGMLGAVVLVGALAIAQLQHDRLTQKEPKTRSAGTSPTSVQPVVDDPAELATTHLSPGALDMSGLADESTIPSEGIPSEGMSAGQPNNFARVSDWPQTGPEGHAVQPTNYEMANPEPMDDMEEAAPSYDSAAQDPAQSPFPGDPNAGLEQAEADPSFAGGQPNEDGAAPVQGLGQFAPPAAAGAHQLGADIPNRIAPPVDARSTDDLAPPESGPGDFPGADSAGYEERDAGPAAPAFPAAGLAATSRGNPYRSSSTGPEARLARQNPRPTNPPALLDESSDGAAPVEGQTLAPIAPGNPAAAADAGFPAPPQDFPAPAADANAAVTGPATAAVSDGATGLPPWDGAANAAAPAGNELPAAPAQPGTADSASGAGGFGGYSDQLDSPAVEHSLPQPSSAPAQEVAPYATSSGTSLSSSSLPGQAGGHGRPGPPELEGPQTASVVIHKQLPDEMRFGQNAIIEIRVRNAGSVAADQVVVRDELPEGMELLQTLPQAQTGPQGELLWNLGTLRPGEEQIVKQEVRPLQEGVVGSVATVSFAAPASGRSRATRPMLKLKHTAPQTVLIGQPVKFAIELSNPGSGTATNVIIEEDVPEGLSHSSGRQIEYKVGNIPPQTTRRLELTLRAAKAGMVDNLLVARAEGELMVEDRAQVQVVAPQLQVTINGPQRRYLERHATFEVVVANPGTADAANVDLLCRLPQGMQFVGTNNAGVYDPNSRTVQWSLARLPASKMGKVEFTVMPTAIGDHTLTAEARGDMNLTDRTEQLVVVEGIAALFFGVADLTDPIEVGGNSRYEIRVVNQGSKPATNIRVVAEAPPGLLPVDGDGPSRAVVNGQQITFEPIPQLAPKSEVKLYVTVKGAQHGQHLFRVRMSSDELQGEVTKEESTMVYSDQ